MVPVGENATERAAILVVDDNQAIGDIFYEKLNSMGYHCCVVESADAALVQLRERPFDIVLLDVKLPGKSGIDLLKDIKSSRSDTAVIMISAVVDPETAIEAGRQCTCDYIIKPFNLDEVVFSIERALAGQYMNGVWRRMLGV
jgi:DNA-binding NtrC family response regulator